MFWNLLSVVNTEWKKTAHKNVEIFDSDEQKQMKMKSLFLFVCENSLESFEF